jgi:hypothetical protein
MVQARPPPLSARIVNSHSSDSLLAPSPPTAWLNVGVSPASPTDGKCLGKGQVEMHIIFGPDDANLRNQFFRRTKSSYFNGRTQTRAESREHPSQLAKVSATRHLRTKEQRVLWVSPDCGGAGRRDHCAIRAMRMFPRGRPYGMCQEPNKTMADDQRRAFPRSRVAPQGSVRKEPSRFPLHRTWHHAPIQGVRN